MAAPDGRFEGGEVVHTVSGDAVNRRNARVGAISGFVGSALLIGIAVVATQFLQGLAGTTEEIIAAFRDYSGLANLAAWLLLLLAMSGVPFFLALRNVLKDRDPTVIAAAAAFSVIGLFVLAALGVVFVGLYLALSVAYAAAPAQDRATVILLADAFSGLLLPMFSLALLSSGVGTAIFGAVTRTSGAFPQWVGYLGMVAGLLGIVAAIPLALVAMAALLGFLGFLFLWILASSAFLWRSSRSAPDPGSPQA